MSVADRWQAQRRAILIRHEVEEIVVRMKKLRGVVTSPGASARAEILVGFDARVVAARDVVRHQIDDCLEPAGVEPLDQLAKFLQAPSGICRVIRTDVEIIFDSVRAARESLQQVGVIRRLTELGVIGGRSLLENPSEPDVGETHPADRDERGVVDIGEFAGAVFREGAVLFPGLVRVAEQPDE